MHGQKNMKKVCVVYPISKTCLNTHNIGYVCQSTRHISTCYKRYSVTLPSTNYTGLNMFIFKQTVAL